MKYLLLALLILPLSACLEKEKEAGSSSLPTSSLTIQSSDGNTHKFTVELATTKKQQIRGLMHRTEMADEAGMLFFFEDEAERGFWMKNTLISLDMLFIKADGTIHHIHEKAIPEDLTSISSGGPVAAVLELNGGLTRKLNIKEGDKVQHKLFGEIKVQ